MYIRFTRGPGKFVSLVAASVLLLYMLRQKSTDREQLAQSPDEFSIPASAPMHRKPMVSVLHSQAELIGSLDKSSIPASVPTSRKSTVSALHSPAELIGSLDKSSIPASVPTSRKSTVSALHSQAKLIGSPDKSSIPASSRKSTVSALHSQTKLIGSPSKFSMPASVPTSAESAPSSPLCGDLPGRFPNSIPPLVHWTSKDGRVAAKLLPLVRTWRLLLNSSTTKWHFMHWDDGQIKALISAHYPRLAASYAKLVNGLERSDIGRLVVLHHVGGIYVDLDVELRRDLSPWLQLKVHNSSSDYITAVWTEEPVEHAVFNFGMPRLISNAVILSRANHSFITYVLRTWPAWFEANWANKTGRVHNDAVQVTGPLMLDAFYERYASLPPAARQPDTIRLVGPAFFQPIWEQIYVPPKVAYMCNRPEKKQTPLQIRHCRRLRPSKFRTKPVPAGSFTVHRFLHTSYTDKMDLANSRNITDLVPVLRCTV